MLVSAVIVSAWTLSDSPPRPFSDELTLII
jgi:hypothetical protein